MEVYENTIGTKTTLLFLSKALQEFKLLNFWENPLTTFIGKGQFISRVTDDDHSLHDHSPPSSASGVTNDEITKKT